MPLSPEFIKEAPEAPGVYLFKGEKGEILYVGKAKNLKKRLSNYLRQDFSQTPKTRALLAKAAEVEIIVARSEKEALLLEANLIKKYRPRYNVILRDDKAYPLLRISLHEKFPGIKVVRRRRKDKALYFGPYPSAGAVRETLRFLGRIFPLRRCSMAEFKRRERPCLYYQIRRCPAPCVGKISEEEYRQIVNGAIMFLRGKAGPLLKRLRAEMEACAERLEFERAAVLRDRIRAIEKTLEAQVVALPEERDLDVFAIAIQGEKISGCVLFVRSGALIGKKNFHLSRADLDEPALFSLLLRQFYDEGKYIPDEILLPREPEDQEFLSEWLSELAGKKVEIKIPKRGARRNLMEMAKKNALEALAARLKGERPYEELAEEMTTRLRLPRVPRRVEGIDISNIKGKIPVGVTISFLDGAPDKGAYRRYHIKGVSQPNDYAMMFEVLRRRLTRGVEENNLPDLLVIDGGKGQLQMALTVLEELGLRGEIGVCAIAKEREKEGDKIYIPGRKNPVNLARHHEILRFLQRVRDEAHRFAVTFHRRTRSKRALVSSLDQIPGVGPKRRQTLLRYFGDLEAIKKASIEEIARLPGLNRKVAQEIKKYLSEEG